MVVLAVSADEDRVDLDELREVVGRSAGWWLAANDPDAQIVHCEVLTGDLSEVLGSA